MNYRKFAWWNTQWAFAGVRDPAAALVCAEPAFDDGRWVFTGIDVDGVGPHEKDSGHSDDGDGRTHRIHRGHRCRGGGAARRAAAASLGARAVERLRHRAAAAGRSERRRSGVRESRGDGAEVRRRLGEHRACAAAGRQPRRRRRGAAAGAGRRSETREDPFLPRRDAEERRPIRRGARGTCARRRSCIRAIASCSISSAASCS